VRPMSGRKGVIVLTDGMDQRLFAGQPPAREEQDFQNVLRAVEQSRSPFYFVAFDTRINPSGGFAPPPKRAVQRMETLAERSGGRVLFPQTIQDVASLYEGIARELSASYSLAYGSTRPQKDGTYRRIEVRLKNSELRVSQSRNGYYADGPKPQDKPMPQSVSNPSSTVNTPKAAGQAPALVTPIDHALLSSPDKNEWRFIWEEVPNAKKYEIVIHAPNVDVPVIKAEMRGTRYVVGRAFRSAGFSAKGWSWQVRAQSANGAWSPWSETRPFDVFK
jgi:hypothetical protein